MSWFKKAWLKKVLIWLLKQLAEEVIALPKIDVPTEDILNHMRQFDGILASGEYKFHQVFAKLTKKYPNVPKSDIKLQIELLYQQYFKNA